MKVVIFDMDGTAIDSGEAIYKTVNEVRDELNLPPLEKEFIIKAINEPGRNLALEFYGIDTPSRSLKEGFEEKFKKFYDECATTYEGVKELLQKCKDAHYKVVLASNAPHDTLEKILKKNEIYELFDEVIGASKEIPQKPDPAMLHLAVSRTKANKAIFVGDSLKDELAAKNANMPYVQVCWGFGEESKTATYNAKNVGEAWEIILNF